jgi:hypothetical protein
MEPWSTLLTSALWSVLGTLLIAAIYMLADM